MVHRHLVLFVYRRSKWEGRISVCTTFFIAVTKNTTKGSNKKWCTETILRWVRLHLRQAIWSYLKVDSAFTLIDKERIGTSTWAEMEIRAKESVKSWTFSLVAGISNFKFWCRKIADFVPDTCILVGSLSINWARSKMQPLVSRQLTCMRMKKTWDNSSKNFKTGQRQYLNSLDFKSYHLKYYPGRGPK